ncbi:hypothetical protein AVEN_93568-1, partial [Araneus ventricosus]
MLYLGRMLYPFKYHWESVDSAVEVNDAVHYPFKYHCEPVDLAVEVEDAVHYPFKYH